MSRHAWLTGNLSAADGYICRRLHIPNNPAYVQAVNGALLELTRDYRWEQEGADTPEAAAAAMWAMWLEYVESNGCMIGLVATYASEEPPDGTLPCDGSVYLREDYPRLYDAILPDLQLDADTFQTPDLTNLFVVAAGGDFEPLDTGGESDVTLTVDQMPEHAHTDAGHTHTIHSHLTAAAVVPGEAPVNTPNIVGEPTGSAQANIQNTGGGQAHENKPPYIALKYCIVADRGVPTSPPVDPFPAFIAAFYDGVANGDFWHMDYSDLWEEYLAVTPASEGERVGNVSGLINNIPLIQVSSQNRPTITGGLLSMDATSPDYMYADALASIIAGQDSPFSLFWFGYWNEVFTGSSTATIWHGGNGSDDDPVMQFAASNTQSPGALASFRRDDASGSCGNQNSTLAIDTNLSGACLSFDGNAVKAWWNETLYIDTTCDVGVITLDRFTLGVNRRIGIQSPLDGLFLAGGIMSKAVDETEWLDLLSEVLG